ncbi:MAG: UDP-N-acetylmuramate dehydrogenase [Bacteroidetes bacterium]|nr:MAG: UDP-N-acetylmuramate dehydrogenase [Bacteroidota bacterium]
MLSKDISLLPYNTFGIDVKANLFVEITEIEDLVQIVKQGNLALPFFILGGGSNLLLTRDVPFLVVKNSIKGKSFNSAGLGKVLVTAGAGENWHEFVVWCLEHNFGGLENLSLIPGTVGAAPIQNIGAYGVELKDVFYSLKAVDLDSGETKIFSREDCNFGYRSSIFKQELKGRYCIVEVSFLLTSEDHIINDNYGAIKSVLNKKAVAHPGIKDIHQAVIDIRRSKLPDPSEIGNAGSFFKNPEISQNHFNKIKAIHPDVPNYPGREGLIKVPAGWLIEQCGWKGKRRGPIGCYDKQALILVNYGGGKGEKIKELSEDIAADVFETFGIKLQREVNVL